MDNWCIAYWRIDYWLHLPWPLLRSYAIAFLAPRADVMTTAFHATRASTPHGQLGRPEAALRLADPLTFALAETVIVRATATTRARLGLGLRRTRCTGSHEPAATDAQHVPPWSRNIRLDDPIALSSVR